MTFCTTAFVRLARSSAEGLGMPDLPIVFLPHPLIRRSREEIREFIDTALAEILKGLVGEAT